MPEIDEEVRRRLTARFGAGVGTWLDDLPRLLATLVDRWQVELGPTVPRGGMSVVVRCRTGDGRPAVLKASPDRTRLANEAAALGRWATTHVPQVYAVDERAGALLLEAVTPGTPLAESPVLPRAAGVAELLTSLYGNGVPDPAYPVLAQRVAYLFESGRKPYARDPALSQVVPPSLYERGRQLAIGLLRHVAPTALLHGDLTPGNVLDGGDRGLVAIDPAPCLGNDPAFDAVDLVLWQAEDLATIETRAAWIAVAIDVDPDRLLDWCTAFAAMTALELAETRSGPPERIRAALTLASHAPVR